MAIFEHKHFTR